MNSCIRCYSFAINHHSHGRDGSDPDLCDVCYWRKRAEEAIMERDQALEKIRLAANALKHHHMSRPGIAAIVQLISENAEGMARELAAQDSESPTKQNG